MDHNPQAVALFDKHAGLYQDKYMDQHLYHHSFDAFCARIETTGASVLEVGCGPGNITRYLLEKRPDFNILATDLAPNMLELAGRNNPDVECMLLDARQIHTLGRHFDAILCGFCLPYLSREEAMRWIADAARALHPGGVLYISTMEDDYSRSGPQTGSTGDQLYMYYHQADYLTEALHASGFSRIELQRQEFPRQDAPPDMDLILIAEKE